MLAEKRKKVSRRREHELDIERPRVLGRGEVQTGGLGYPRTEESMEFPLGPLPSPSGPLRDRITLRAYVKRSNWRVGLL